ncbi:MAG TPA: lysylphosphatidylglycerol synthase domain-containing protein, partial [Dongiaceae bacterium]|nr:lysylphosphatidylglycerol synthase domain-containing protein [Dongiaceae bacterium]
LIVGLGFAAVRLRTNVSVLMLVALFIGLAIALTVALLALSGRRVPRHSRLARLPVVRRVARFLEDADAKLARDPRLLGGAIAWQAAIFVLDAATMWALIRSLGGIAPAAGVFASFMIASLVRSMGIVPGGLGTYEAASVLTLRLIGVEVPVALSATLAFRVLSFWLPMAPGIWSARGLAARGPEPQGAPEAGAYWARDERQVAAELGSGRDGLSSEDAASRLHRYGPNQIHDHPVYSSLRVLLAQLRNPLLLILVFAAIASAFSGEWIDATIVLVIVFASVGIGFSRESSAHAAVAALQARVRTRATVVRDGRNVMVPVDEVVPGDVVMLSAGSLVPGDGRILEATDFFVGESALTGESFPVEKRPGVKPATAALRDRDNCVFLGT